MGKRTRQTSANAEVESDTLSGDEDWISKLPDDILLDIINRLSLGEAARTSVLSSRWKYLWTFSTVLNFDAPKKLWQLRKLRTLYTRTDLEKRRKEVEERRSKYISWVNKVLELHRGSSINEFRICFELCDSNKTIITDWIYTVIAKRVQKLELNLGQLSGVGGKSYTFPQELFNILKTPHGLAGIKSLRSLSLVDVNVTRETLEFFIYNCPLLERLQVENSKQVSGLKVVGSSIQLKYLDIYGCFSIDEIEISAPSLLSFKYFGRKINLRIENVPLLLDVSIGWDFEVPLESLIAPIRSYLTQLETLELHLDLHEDDTRFPICELPKLRHLTFDISGPGSKNLLELTSMIKACPFLQKFTVKFVYISYSGRRKVLQFPKCSLHHLKVVELIGFVGRPFDLELAFYLLENAIKLEKMIINPTNPFYLGKYLEFEDDKDKKAARKRAQLLEEKVPQGVELVIC